MKRIKKCIFIILTLAILLSSTSVVFAAQPTIDMSAYSSTSEEAFMANVAIVGTDCDPNNGDCLRTNTGEKIDAIGLQISLLTYDYKTGTENVEKKIKIINPALLNTVILKQSSPLPGSEDDLGKDGYDLVGIAPSQPADGLPVTDKGNRGDIRVDDLSKYINMDGKPHKQADGTTYSKANKYAMKGTYDIRKEIFWSYKTDPEQMKKNGYQYDLRGCANTTNSSNLFNENKTGISLAVSTLKEWFSNPFTRLEEDDAKQYDVGTDLGYISYLMTYVSPGNNRITYKGDSDHIRNYPTGIVYWDSSLSEAAIRSGYLDGNLDKTIRNKYFADISTINSKFHTTITAENIGKYYIEVQGIYRVFLDEKKPTGTYIAKSWTETVMNSILSTGLEEMTGDKNRYCPIDTHEHEVTPAKDAWCEYTVTGKKSKVHTTKDTCKGKNYEWHSKVDAVTTTYCGDDNKSWKQYLKVKNNYKFQCGIKHSHKILGRTYDGISELRLTKKKAANCTSTQTYLYDLISDNRHCRISDSSNKYSQQELDNLCAKAESAAHTDNDYYIGPDKVRALVGAYSNNRYNLFETSGVSNIVQPGSCDEGVKHYYVIDLPPKTQNICRQVCTGKRNTDSYLKCAENYCDHDVDSYLKGSALSAQPFNRKKECILFQCGYIYGRENPKVANTGDENANEVSQREAESSCKNTGLFMKDNGNSYSPISELLAGDMKLTTTCGHIDSDTNIDQKVSHKSQCYGDKVTDYNKEPNDETPIDQRTYINYTCMEENQISHITNVSGKFAAGIPLDYDVKTASSVRCVAFFNYEQWKVDYAAVPLFDKIRRGKLQYIYEKFNDQKGTPSITSAKGINPYDPTDEIEVDFTVVDYGIVDFTPYQYKPQNTTVTSTTFEKTTDGDVTVPESPPEVLKNINNNQNNSTAEVDLYKNSDIKAYRKKHLVTVAKNSAITHSEPINGYENTTSANTINKYKKSCYDYQTHTMYYPDADGMCNRGITANSPGPTNAENVIYLRHNLVTKNTTNENRVETNTKIVSSLPELVTEPTPATIGKAGDTYLTAIDDAETCYSPDNGIPTPDLCPVYPDERTFVGDNAYDEMISLTIKAYDSTYGEFTPRSMEVTITKSSESRPRVYNISTDNIDIFMSDTARQTTGTEKVSVNVRYTDIKGVTKECYGGSYEIINVDTNKCSINKIVTGKKYRVKTVTSNYDERKGGIFIGSAKPWGKNNNVPLGLVNTDRDGIFELEDVDMSTEPFITGYIHIPSGSDKGGYYCPDPERLTDNYCKQDVNPVTGLATLSGRGLYFPGQAKEIDAYCSLEKNRGQTQSKQDCVKQCRQCPVGNLAVDNPEDTKEKITNNINKVKTFCTQPGTNYRGFGNEADCTNWVYTTCIESGVDAPYKYRPVNTQNPFPGAADNLRVAPEYDAGERPIGSNWVKKENYITDTSTKNVLYKVILDPGAIADIKSYVNSQNSAYVYTNENYAEDSGPRTFYRSSLIRSGDYSFRKYFCVIGGVPTKGENCYE